MRFSALCAALVFSWLGCSSDGDKEPPAEKEPPAKKVPAAKADQGNKRDTAAPSSKSPAVADGLNVATVKFADFTGSVAMIGAAKLSRYTILTFRTGKVGVNVAAPSLAKGTYQADGPNQGVAITVTDARAGRMGQPGFKMYKMKTGEVVIEQDGDVVEGTYKGVVVAGEEIVVSGSFKFERSKFKQQPE